MMLMASLSLLLPHSYTLTWVQHANVPLEPFWSKLKAFVSLSS